MADALTRLVRRTLAPEDSVLPRLRASADAQRQHVPQGGAALPRVERAIDAEADRQDRSREVPPGVVIEVAVDAAQARPERTDAADAGERAHPTVRVRQPAPNQPAPAGGAVVPSSPLLGVRPPDGTATLPPSTIAPRPPNPVVPFAVRPAARRTVAHQAPTPEPVVRITIGRLEVRAETATTPAPTPAERARVLPLEQYLAQRAERRP